MSDDVFKERDTFAADAEEQALKRRERMARLIGNEDFKGWVFDFIYSHNGFQCSDESSVFVSGRASVVDDLRFEIGHVNGGAEFLGKLTEKFWDDVKGSEE